MTDLDLGASTARRITVANEGLKAADTFRDLLPTFLIIASVLGGLAVAGWLLGETFGFFDTAEDGLYAGFLIALLVFLCGGLLVRGRHRIGSIVKSLLAWVAIGLVAVAGYGYRHELTMVWQRVVGELSPGTAVYGDRSLTVRASGNGAFFMDVFLNGRPARMLVDTGATGLAFLPATPARPDSIPTCCTTACGYRPPTDRRWPPGPSWTQSRSAGSPSATSRHWCCARGAYRCWVSRSCGGSSRSRSMATG